ncbi:hypothetical protein BGX28_003156 [Mortierella sp. GBA30]|nr:hypothetical protein BGX28_003156 [Mortierella sp. GBA30]
MGTRFEQQDLHVAVIPAVAVEFTTIVDQDGQESPVRASLLNERLGERIDIAGSSPMESEEFAYPSNLTSEPLDYPQDDHGEEQDQKTHGPGSAASARIFVLDEDTVTRGHFRANNASTGSDLIQVTVEDLLISEAQDQKIRATVDLFRQEQQQQCPEPSSSMTTFSNANSTITRAIITATIRSTGQNRKVISFQDESSVEDQSFEAHDSSLIPTKQEEGGNIRKMRQEQEQKPQSTISQTPQQNKQESRPSQPTLPRILTPAQQREAEADANIQKAIELHENNQLEEATRYFWLAAQSENPLGQLMTSSSASISQNHHQRHQQQTQLQHGTAKPAQQTLRRMASMDRNAAMLMARKELVMALYELGMSYLKGWGVIKDKTVAFTYFKIAADLGDPDSQNETALCYYEGIGTDKDMFQSAKYYRMAAAQGASQLGNSWIWKPKYDQYCAAENAASTINSSSSSNSSPRAKKLSSTINTAMFQGSSISPSSPLSSSTLTPSSSPKKTKTQSLTATSPSIPNPQCTLSSIASGLASVTAARGTTTAIATASSSNSLSSASSSSFRTSDTEFSPTSPSPLASSLSKPSSMKGEEKKQGPAASSDTLEKKKQRWSLWGGGSHRSSITPSPTTTMH